MTEQHDGLKIRPGLSTFDYALLAASLAAAVACTAFAFGFLRLG